MYLFSVVSVVSSTGEILNYKFLLPILSSSPILVTRITDPDLLLNLDGGLVEAPDFMEIESKSTFILELFVRIEFTS